jgi:dolichyl-diphosphooligosaccharide--protein glycosyltransferase
VKAEVEMAIQFPKQPGTFNYTQYAETGPDGEFEMTLPYSTTGYENWGPENGYTNVSVRATGPYTFTAGTSVNQSTLDITQWRAEADVSEAKVIGEDTEGVSVSLEKEVVGNLQPEPQNQTNTTNSSDAQSALSSTLPSADSTLEDSTVDDPPAPTATEAAARVAPR